MLTWTDTAISQSYEIHGFHGEVVAPAPKLQLASKYLWGLKGNVVIIGNQTVRELSVNIWLSDYQWEDVKDLYDYVAGTLEDLVGTYGYLTVTTDNDGYWPTAQYQTFEDLLFLSYENVAFPGQDVPSPILDQAGTLYRHGTGQGNLSWLQNMNLTFLQTVPGRTVNTNPPPP